MTQTLEKPSPSAFGRVGKERCRSFRKRILDISQLGTTLRIAPAFLCLELVDAVYCGMMRPDSTQSDTFIPSNGHGCLWQYATLEELGILTREVLETFCKPGGQLGSHPNSGVPGIQRRRDRQNSGSVYLRLRKGGAALAQLTAGAAAVRTIVSAATLKPLDQEGSRRSCNASIVSSSLKSTRRRGAGPKMKQVAPDSAARCEHRTSLQDRFIHFFGSQAELFGAHGLTLQRVCADIGA